MLIHILESMANNCPPSYVGLESSVANCDADKKVHIDFFFCFLSQKTSTNSRGYISIKYISDGNFAHSPRLHIYLVLLFIPSMECL